MQSSWTAGLGAAAPPARPMARGGPAPTPDHDLHTAHNGHTKRNGSRPRPTPVRGGLSCASNPSESSCGKPGGGRRRGLAPRLRAGWRGGRAEPGRPRVFHGGRPRRRAGPGAALFAEIKLGQPFPARHELCRIKMVERRSDPGWNAGHGDADGGWPGSRSPMGLAYAQLPRSFRRVPRGRSLVPTARASDRGNGPDGPSPEAGFRLGSSFGGRAPPGGSSGRFRRPERKHRASECDRPCRFETERRKGRSIPAEAQVASIGTARNGSGWSTNLNDQRSMPNLGEGTTGRNPRTLTRPAGCLLTR